MDYKESPTLVAAQDILKAEDKHVARLTYTGNLDGKAKIGEEHVEAKWMTGKELKNLPPEQLDSYFRELIDRQIIIL